jgi:hypothetical protein
VRRWPANARTWVRPWRGTWAGGLGGADGWGPRDRERAGACARETAPTGRPHRTTRGRERERERGREEVRGLAPTSGARLSGTEGAQAHARGAGPGGPTGQN